MSKNRARPKFYSGFHQTDVIHIKAYVFRPRRCDMWKLTLNLSLERLRLLINEEDLFFLIISPTALHVQNLTDLPSPPSRYFGVFNSSKVPRTPNFNPPPKEQKGKPSWLRELPLLNSIQIDEINQLYQRRLESLRGIDNIITDVIELLADQGVIGNIYSMWHDSVSMITSIDWIPLLTDRSHIFYRPGLSPRRPSPCGKMPSLPWGYKHPFSCKGPWGSSRGSLLHP